MPISRLTVVALVLVVLAVPSQAWVAKNSEAPGLVKQKKLSRFQQKYLAVRVVGKLVKNDFFTEVDLPRKFVLSRFELHGDDLATTAVEFTDLILNTMLNHAKILVVNQDLKIDLSLDYKLMWYLDEFSARKKGILLGADYIVVGDLSSGTAYTPRGLPKKIFTVAVVIKDIRSGEVILTEEYSLSASKKRRR